MILDKLLPGGIHARAFKGQIRNRQIAGRTADESGVVVAVLTISGNRFVAGAADSGFHHHIGNCVAIAVDGRTGKQFVAVGLIPVNFLLLRNAVQLDRRSVNRDPKPAGQINVLRNLDRIPGKAHFIRFALPGIDLFGKPGQPLRTGDGDGFGAVIHPIAGGSFCHSVRPGLHLFPCRRYGCRKQRHDHYDSHDHCQQSFFHVITFLSAAPPGAKEAPRPSKSSPVFLCPPKRAYCIPHFRTETQAAPPVQKGNPVSVWNYTTPVRGVQAVSQCRRKITLICKIRTPNHKSPCSPEKARAFWNCGGSYSASLSIISAVTSETGVIPSWKSR